MSDDSTLTVSYSDVEGGESGAYVEPGGTLTWGDSNIDADPLFADPDNDDYHLKSARGRWDSGTETWVTDAVTSPCIDAGDPASDYSNEPDPNGGRVNMGAWGNTGQASKSPPAAIDDLAASLTAKLTVASAAGSTVLYNQYVAANAIDGNPNTFWSSSMSTVPRTESLTLDLGATREVGKVRLLPRATSPELFPGEFTIDVSTDGDNWTQVISETGYVAQSGVWYEKRFGSQNARYVRLNGDTMLYARNGLYYMQTAELNAYAPAGNLANLSWTAPGDVGNTGTAASYEVRYGAQEITTQTIWDAATGVAGEPAPEIAGTSQSMTINTSALPAAARVYFAIRTTNEAAVESDISNSPYVDTPAVSSGHTPPAK